MFLGLITLAGVGPLTPLGGRGNIRKKLLATAINFRETEEQTMKPVAFVMVLLTWGFMLAAPSYGQQAGDVWAARGQYTWLFDSKTMETLSGEVAAVGKFTPRGKPEGVRFTLRTDQGPIEVILGSSAYVAQQGLRFEPQDKVTVKGSRVAVEGKPTIIATEVTKGEKTLKLRDVNGAPFWNRQSTCSVSH
jgi:hypothetical protein